MGRSAGWVEVEVEATILIGTCPGGGYESTFGPLNIPVWRGIIRIALGAAGAGATKLPQLEVQVHEARWIYISVYNKKKDIPHRTNIYPCTSSVFTMNAPIPSFSNTQQYHYNSHE